MIRSTPAASAPETIRPPIIRPIGIMPQAKNR